MGLSMPPPLPSAQAGAPMSLGARLMNVFTGPGEVFEQIKKGPPSNANWLLPGLLLCLVGMISTWVVFSQEAVVRPLRDKQERAIRKRLEKVPQEHRQTVLKTAEKFTGPAVMKVVGSVGAVVRGFGWLFLMATVVWLLGTHRFKGSFTFLQAVEVCGLAAMISVLGSVITMLLVLIMGNSLASPGPALLVWELDASNPLHVVLSALNVTTLWYLGVLAIGLGKLSGVSLPKAAGWLFAVWALFGITLALMTAVAQRL